MATDLCSGVDGQQNSDSAGQIGSDQVEVEHRTNLIVNYLPRTITQGDIRSLFSIIGEIQSCKLISVSGHSLGYGFVNYHRPEHAKKAITTLNGWNLHNKNIKVSYARPNSEAIQKTNLFISGLPKSMTQQGLETMFCTYGDIIKSNIICDNKTGLSKGFGFVRFNEHLEAKQAIDELNGTKPNDFTETITVRFAYDSNKNNKITPPLLTHCTPHFAHRFPDPIYRPISYFRNSQFTVELPNNAMFPENAMNGSGWCIFIYNLESDAEENVLWQLFGPFGAVRNVVVIRHMQTNKCKGFGFVTMSKYDEAINAIQSLNGYILSNRKLQVRFKTNKSKTSDDYKDDDVRGVRVKRPRFAP